MSYWTPGNRASTRQPVRLFAACSPASMVSRGALARGGVPHPRSCTGPWVRFNGGISMRRTYTWLCVWFMGICCAFGLGACGDAIGSFVVDFIVAPIMGKDP